MTKGDDRVDGPRLTRIRVQGFRSIRDASFEPGPLAALVGEPGTGKSNLLAAIRAAFDPRAPLTGADLTRGSEGDMQIDIDLSDGRAVSLRGMPRAASTTDHPPEVVYLPASARAGEVIAGDPAGPAAEHAGRLICGGDQEPNLRSGSTEAAHGLVYGLEGCVDAGVTGLLLLIEEPELFLAPQMQRYLYRVLRRLAENGNQILYSTHSPSFLNVARLDELVLTEHDPGAGTRFVQPENLPSDEEFRAYSEFDASRSELFLARAVILVEGQTERLALPFVFRALGHDADRERISIVECGGKSNILLVGGVAKAVGIPFIAVHDRDAPRGKRPNRAEQQLNKLIRGLAGENEVELTPDFEGVAGLTGHRHKPARAWRSFASLQRNQVPRQLAHIVERALAMARHPEE